MTRTVRPRRSVIAFTGLASASDWSARALERSLIELGVETTYLGRESDARLIADAVLREGADCLELCMARGTPGVLLLRELLRRLTELGRRDVSIVLHRVN
jgi:hypothetical protein